MTVSVILLPGLRGEGPGLLHLLGPWRGEHPWLPGGEIPPSHPEPNQANHHLTAREIAVLDLFARGENTAGVARRLGISPATARNHTQHLLKKLGVHSRLAAVALADRSPAGRLSRGAGRSMTFANVETPRHLARQRQLRQLAPKAPLPHA